MLNKEAKVTFHQIKFDSFRSRLGKPAWANGLEFGLDIFSRKDPELNSYSNMGNLRTHKTYNILRNATELKTQAIKVQNLITLQ